MQTLRKKTCTFLLTHFRPSRITQTAGIQSFETPVIYKDIEFPERRRLRVMEKVPQYSGQIRPFKMQKKLKLMRGPEQIHNTLLHEQYGIVAKGGGRLKSGHFEMIRMTFVRKLDFDRAFAIWRVDPPWQPVTKKSQGQRMGGGKGSINHYVTPIKAGRVIVEIAGYIEYLEIKHILEHVAQLLPFKAVPVNQQILEEMKEKERKIEEDNLHPWTWKYMIQNNMTGCHNWVSPTDKVWYNKHL